MLIWGSSHNVRTPNQFKPDIQLTGKIRTQMKHILTGFSLISVQTGDIVNRCSETSLTLFMSKIEGLRGQELSG